MPPPRSRPTTLLEVKRWTEVVTVIETRIGRATARKEEPGWSLSSRSRSPPPAATSRCAAAREIAPETAGMISASEADEAPFDDRFAGEIAMTARAPASVTILIRSASEGKPGTSGPRARISATAPRKSAPASWSMPRSGMRAPWPAKMTGASAIVSEDRVPWRADIAGLEGDGGAVRGPADLAAADAALDEADRLEPGAALARRLEAARAELLGDIVCGQPLAFAARRAALELVAGQHLDVAHHVGGGDRRGLLGGERKRRQGGEQARRRGATA